MKAVELTTENGSQVIIAPDCVTMIRRVKDPERCVIRSDCGEVLQLRQSPEDVAAILDWELPAPTPQTTAADTKAPKPAKKTVRAGVKKEKIKTARAEIAGKGGMAA